MVRASEKKRISNATLGLILAVVLALASYLAFTKELPWGGGTEYRVVFNSAQNLRVNSPVRIAGVEAGTVTGVEPLAPNSESDADGDGEADAATTESVEGGGALVTLEMSEDGLPLKEDAHFRLRPRLFLEGNLFVEVSPGSPAAPEADPSGDPFPPDSTSNSVQLDQVLTGALQQDSRRDLQTFLDQFGEALIDADGAESFRTLYKTSPGAFKYTSQVNEATLGENPHDLSGVIKNLGLVLRGLGRNETALQDTVTNLRIVTGSFAAEDAALERAIVELPQVLEAADPAFTNLNAAFPPLRAFSREILPGTRSAPKTLDVATPLLKQIRLLSRKSELRGLARDLVPAVPALANLSKKTPKFLEQGRALASCFNNVIIPWSLDSVDPPANYPLPVAGRVFEETGYGLTGIAGESRSQDANGQYIRIAGGGGTNTITTVGEGGQTLAGTSQFPLAGAVPGLASSARTPFKPDEPCENQEAPNLGATYDDPPDQTTSAAPAGLPLSAPSSSSGKADEIIAQSNDIFEQIGAYGAAKAGDDNAGAREVQQGINKSVKRFYKKFGSN